MSCVCQLVEEFGSGKKQLFGFREKLRLPIKPKANVKINYINADKVRHPNNDFEPYSKQPKKQQKKKEKQNTTTIKPNFTV